MQLDTAIQDMLFNQGEQWVKITAELAIKDKNTSIYRYQQAYNWTIEECEEFLDNVALAYELLIKDKAA